MKKDRRDTLEKEIKLLKNRQKVENDLDLRELQIKSSPGTWDIGDLIVTCDTKILMKEVEINKIDDDIEIYNLYLNNLEDIETKIIDLRYFSKKKRRTFIAIAENIKFSKSTVKDKHDEAIEKLAFYKYGEKAMYF
ncbi:hypothetical protein [Paraclostridium bifermentans]|uniref:hypothetical protein n=1 Tax=Paraclostridium bifermentans TaxID=1490 RepID=UPI00359C9ACC